MAKFLTLPEAAQQLGVAPEEINELRQQGQLNGYRDGASWKFKPEDVQRAAERLAQAAAGPGDIDESSEISLDDIQLDDISLDDISLEDIRSIGEPVAPKSASDMDIGLSTDDVVLLSEFELGESGPSASQTVIGHPGMSLSPQESDIKLRSVDDDAGASSIGQPVELPGGSQDPGASAIKLDAGIFDEDSTSKTTIGAPGQGLSPDESTIELRSDDFDFASASSTVIGRPGENVGGASGVKIEAADDDVFNLDLDDDDPIASAPPPPAKAPGGSAIRFDAPPTPDPVLDSGITLADENSDDEFVLGGPGSDITISPGDSGISLVDPSDSGLSLDAPLELGGSSGGESSFELTGSGEDLGSAADFDSDEVMDLKTGDEFLLTPMAADGEDSSEDSGSQVIAIDAEGAFEDSDSGMFSSMGDSSQSALLEEDVSAGAGPLGGGSLGAAAPALAGSMAPAGMAVVGEAPYPTWIVAMMFFCVLFMALCGMMLYDLVRNMWSWNAPYTVNSSIMDLIMGMFGGS